MSGHSKWSNIKHKKELEDFKKGKVFTRLANAITVAAKKGGSDVDSNASLRLAVDKAKEENMPKDKINKAIDRASGADAKTLENITYECYGPGGVAIMIHVFTDNRNRTASDVRAVLNKYNISLGSPNSAAYIFSSGNPSFKIDLLEGDKDPFSSLISDIEEIDEVEDVIHNANI